jgi:N-acetylglucosamine kinase-like BadF-type ATPase
MTIDEGYFLGVDGGGTKTEALLADSAGRILGRGVAGPSNPLFSGDQAAVEAVSRAVADACQELVQAEIHCAAVCVPGLTQLVDTQDLGNRIQLGAAKVAVEGDDRSTYYGALGEGCGIVVLAGTGSFVMGMDASGRSISQGGWGPLLGDEGSGFAIGRDALRAVIAACESRAAPTRLTTLVLDRYQVGEPLALRTRVYRGESYQQEVASLVPLVAQAAQEGDDAAVKILRRAGEDLAQLALDAARSLQLEGADARVVLSGGVANLGEFLWEPFRQKIRQVLGRSWQVGPARYNPAIGALLVAYRMAGLTADPTRLAQLDCDFRRYYSPSGQGER